MTYQSSTIAAARYRQQTMEAAVGTSEALSRGSEERRVRERESCA
jgi:hypothetical protein